MTEAELLFAEVLGCDRAALYLDRTKRLGREKGAFISSVLRRRSQGEPFAYILGSVEFMGLEFSVDCRVLVPRQETEILVEKALEWSTRAQEHRSTRVRILEIGTGSGCIAVSLAKFLPQAKILATDVSGEALAVARENAERLGVAARIDFVCCDLVPERTPERFDLVVSNPPYVRSPEIAGLAREISHEPRLALDGGPDGLDAFRRIIPRAAAVLDKNGCLMLETGYDQSPAVTRLIEEYKFFAVEGVVKDYNGIDRVVVARKRELQSDQ